MTDINKSNNLHGGQDSDGVSNKETLNFSLFRNLCSYNSKTVSFDELERLVRYDADVKDKSAASISMKNVVGKKEADDQVKQKLLPAVSVAVLFNGSGK